MPHAAKRPKQRCHACSARRPEASFASSSAKICTDCTSVGTRWCTLCSQPGDVSLFDAYETVHRACSAEHARNYRRSRRQAGDSGVYVIALDGVPVYVGQAQCMAHRRKEHSGETSGNSCKQAYVLRVMLPGRVTFSSIPVVVSRLDEVERRLIETHRPRLNKTHNKQYYREFTAAEIDVLRHGGARFR